MPLKGGNVFVDDIEVGAVGPVTPGTPIPVSVTVGNGALLISPDDDDACSNPANACDPPGFLETTGYCIGVSWSLGGFVQDTQEACIQIAFSGVGRHTFESEVSAPGEPGRHDIDIQVFAGGTGESETFTRTIAVEAENGDDGDEGDGDNGAPAGPLGLTRTQALVLGGGALVGLGALAAVAGDRP